MDILGVIKRHGFTQSETAERMGVTKGTLSFTIKRGAPTMLQLRRIAEAVGAHMTEFFEDELPEQSFSAPIAEAPQSEPIRPIVGTIQMNGKTYGLVEMDVPIATPEEHVA